MTPPPHDGVPGILGLAAVALMVAAAVWVRIKRWARRTLARHEPVAHVSYDEGIPE